MSEPGSPSPYEHRFHAGNVGDVWKHVAWLALLDAIPGPRAVLDTHAGAGAYPLGGTGEWTAGIGRLWESGVRAGAVGAYLDALSAAGTRAPTRPYRGNQVAIYPGSPALTATRLGAGEPQVAVEVDPAVAAGLPREVARVGDGWAIAATWAPPAGHAPVVLIDPPYTDRADWGRAAELVAALAVRLPSAVIALWYPIKAYTRPNGIHHALRRAGVPCLALDLVTTSLELRRNALAGSGFLVARPPSSLAPTLATAAGVLGPVLASHPPEWSLRAAQWG